MNNHSDEQIASVKPKGPATGMLLAGLFLLCSLGVGAGGVGWYFLQEKGKKAVFAAQQAEKAETEARIANKLQACQEMGNTVVFCYQAVLAEEPTNQETLKRLAQIVD